MAASLIDIDRILGEAVGKGDLVGAAAAVVTPAGVTTGSAGRRDGERDMAVDTVFWIASMTKAITALAAMQLVEQGRLDLDAPAGELIPFLSEVQVLDGFGPDDQPVLRPPKRPVTLRHLLSHTSGFAYDWNHAELDRYLRVTGSTRAGTGLRLGYQQPLMDDPGERWAYGIGIDWAGQMVEVVTGTRVDEHVTAAILEPLGMVDTTFHRDQSQRERTAQIYHRGPAGLVPHGFSLEDEPEMVLAGGGLHSTVGDYLRFTRAILGGGELDGVRVASPETVALLGTQQFLGPEVGRWKTNSPVFSNDVEFYPGVDNAWGLSSLINTETTLEGRTPGSLAWAGLANTYYWIDPLRQVAGVFATQVFPFYDGPSLDAFHAVERATYSSLSR